MQPRVQALPRSSLPVRPARLRVGPCDVPGSPPDDVFACCRCAGQNSISASARNSTARTVLRIGWSRSSTDRGPWIVRPPPAHPYGAPTGLRYRDAAPQPASLRRLRRACRSSNRPGGHQQPHRNIAFLPLTRTRSVKEAARLAGRAQKRRPNRPCEGSFERISSDDVFRTFSVRPSRCCAKSLKRWRTRQDSNLWPLPSEGSALSS